MKNVGVDIGGTNITVGVVDDRGSVTDREKVSTPTGGVEAVVDAVRELVTAMGEKGPVGVGVPGPVRDGVVRKAPNLVGWGANVPLGDLLRAALGTEVVVGNDASVGTYGEWRAGAAQGVEHVLGVWLGTGVGGGVIADGRLIEGGGGAAGEFGHTIVQPGGAMCACGKRGCVEAYAGRAAMERAVHLAVAAGRSDRLLELQASKGKQSLTSAVWAAALDEEDELASELWDRGLDALAVAIGSACTLLDVDRVVLGGGMAEKMGDALADELWQRASHWVMAPRSQQKLVVAALGDDSGLVGAALLARSAGQD